MIIEQEAILATLDPMVLPTKQQDYLQVPAKDAKRPFENVGKHAFLISYIHKIGCVKKDIMEGTVEIVKKDPGIDHIDTTLK